jgi:4-amino-4-deoxy-L-arabinose transferase-like glycosyltransferase
VLRFAHLGRPSLWYDEVVTMRLARQPDPQAMVRLLMEIDATRAPLHPLLLHFWMGLLGPSEWSARAFSACCGVGTVGLVYLLGRDAFDRRAGLWAAYLAALSPALVRYSQEVRMYSWLVLITCVAWSAMPRVRHEKYSKFHILIFEISKFMIFYSHPLGLLILAVLVPVSARSWRRSGRSWSSWSAWQVPWVVATLPWLPRYFDHPPESAVGRLPLRFLLGLPIEFIGGNFLTLGVAALVIAMGAIGLRGAQRDLGLGPPSRWWDMVAWFAVPPVLLYGYSLVFHPVFGPARYTLFVAPAYLLLVGRGLAQLPRRLALGLVVCSTLLSASMLRTMVYDPEIKADWRAAAVGLDRAIPTGRAVVAVASADPRRNVEVETARYYLPERFEVVDAEGLREFDPITAFAVGTRNGQPAAPVPLEVLADAGLLRFPGLIVYLPSGAAGP